jgi:hypothetical protein
VRETQQNRSLFCGEFVASGEFVAGGDVWGFRCGLISRMYEGSRTRSW